MHCRLMLYCSLTGQLMDKSVEAIKKHMKGKKFERNKGEYKAGIRLTFWQAMCGVFIFV